MGSKELDRLIGTFPRSWLEGFALKIRHTARAEPSNAFLQLGDQPPAFKLDFNHVKYPLYLRPTMPDIFLETVKIEHKRQIIYQWETCAHTLASFQLGLKLLTMLRTDQPEMFKMLSVITRLNFKNPIDPEQAFNQLISQYTDAITLLEHRYSYYVQGMSRVVQEKGLDLVIPKQIRPLKFTISLLNLPNDYCLRVNITGKNAEIQTEIIESCSESITEITCEENACTASDYNSISDISFSSSKASSIALSNLSLDRMELPDIPNIRTPSPSRTEVRTPSPTIFIQTAEIMLKTPSVKKSVKEKVTQYYRSNSCPHLNLGFDPNSVLVKQCPVKNVSQKIMTTPSSSGDKVLAEQKLLNALEPLNELTCLLLRDGSEKTLLHETKPSSSLQSLVMGKGKDDQPTVAKKQKLGYSTLGACLQAMSNSCQNLGDPNTQLYAKVLNDTPLQPRETIQSLYDDQEGEAITLSSDEEEGEDTPMDQSEIEHMLK
jgi:hypothetical protein